MAEKKDASKKPRKTASSAEKPVASGTSAATGKSARTPRASTRSARTKALPAKVFNIYYRDDQIPHLDPQFVPYDNSENGSHLLELDVFRTLFGSKQTKGAAYWGALSWKFHQKSGLTAADLFDVIEKNPGYDCYFCNPHPEVESIFHNIWIQGETSHPNFLQLSVELFKAAGLDPRLLTAIFPSKYFASANFFVANDKFWKAYLDFVGDVLEKAEANLPIRVKQAMYSSVADPKSLHADAGYWPFFVERLFSIFLATQMADLKVFKFQTKAPALEANVHHKLLLQMKDTAWQGKSNWMAVCWVNYRNLYLAETFGKAWVKKYINSITPRSIVFV